MRLYTATLRRNSDGAEFKDQIICKLANQGEKFDYESDALSYALADANVDRSDIAFVVMPDTLLEEGSIHSGFTVLSFKPLSLR